MSKILFLTTAHRFDDDRIFYHQAKELLSHGFQVKICSLCSDFVGDKDGVEIESYNIIDQSSETKTKKFLEVCNQFQPDCVIASEPLAVISAGKFRKSKKISLIYDITEWYPSMRMVAPYSKLSRPFHALKFFLIQLYAGFQSTHFIFGEETKKFPLAYFFPFKKKITLPYFPDESYIFQNIKKLESGKISLVYTGMISKEKGIENFFNAIDVLRRNRPNLDINILIVGSTRKDSDEDYFQELLRKFNFKNLSFRKPVSFEKFTESFADADVCFDLREINYENHHCLPIKIFYYAATGKPVIYSDLKATRNEVDVEKFGYLVNPEDSATISKHIENYIDNPELYHQHANFARAEFEKKHNWNLIRNSFVNFVKNSVE